VPPKVNDAILRQIISFHPCNCKNSSLRMSGTRGRPRLQIDVDYVIKRLNQRYTLKQIAEELEVNTHLDSA
jgi:hypothetical protein